MHHHYSDILSRIPEPPHWWDEHAVPRWGPFAPDATANIYADEVALVEIACQNCGTRFRVAFTDSRGGRMTRQIQRGGQVPELTLADVIRSGQLHYGDPPNAGCCPAGPTMNCDDLRVLEYWRRPNWDWERDPSLELALERPTHDDA